MTILQNSIDAFLQELAHFDYGLSSIDHIWNVLFPYAKDKWTHIHINKYRDAYFISQFDERNTEYAGLEVERGKIVKPLTSFGASSSWTIEDDMPLAANWMPLIAAAH